MGAILRANRRKEDKRWSSFRSVDTLLALSNIDGAWKKAALNSSAKELLSETGTSERNLDMHGGGAGVMNKRVIGRKRL
jgi:hypothetical protein